MAAHRAGLTKDELYVYGVSQGKNHEISIIDIEGYFVPFGYLPDVDAVSKTLG